MKADVVTKVQVASRQLREAILLFFAERDAIAIHTIMASAHQVLIDIGKREGVQSVVKNTSALQKDEVQEFLRTVNYPYNFFKHAERDPEKSINVGPLLELTADLIMDGVVMLQRVAGEIPIEAKIFWCWFVSAHPELFDDLPQDGEIARLQSLDVGKWSFAEITAFFKFAEVAGEASALPFHGGEGVRS